MENQNKIILLKDLGMENPTQNSTYKRIHLGYFNTALDGALAYDNYIIEHNLEHTKNFT